MDQHLLDNPLLQRRRRYPSDVTDDQWSRIAPLLPLSAEAGRPRQVELREVINGINFRWTTGCVWRMLPHDLPPWETIYTYYRQWMQAGLLPRIRQELTRRASRSPQGSRKNSSVESRGNPLDASGSAGHSSDRKPAGTHPDRPPVPHSSASEFASRTDPGVSAASVDSLRTPGIDCR